MSEGRGVNGFRLREIVAKSLKNDWKLEILYWKF